MAFELGVIRNGVTYSLTAGTPFLVASAKGMAGPAVVRNTLRAPLQDGDTDYGYNLEPRTITLSLHFSATSGSALDGYRDTFYNIFRPERSTSYNNPTDDPRFQAQTPLTLEVTRDDGAVRRIDCYATGEADIVLDPAHKAGNLHRAVVTLVAPNPTWYAATETNFVIDDEPFTLGGYIMFGDVAYTGTWFAYPVITLEIGTSSMGSCDVHNLSTDQTVTFTDSIPPNGRLQIDTQNNIAYINGGRVYSTNTYDVSKLRLVPPWYVVGGNNTYENVYAITGNVFGTVGVFSMTYHARYLSY